ncbi:MAG: outer membrane beta-barrel protein [Muribaculaceae bacterium]|nr:outer membrane beta-barrel protein [Muribaculaceae bacterium]
MSFKYLLTGLLLCPTLNTLFATAERFEGTVIDTSGSPIEFANVTLLSLNDSTLIDGKVTEPDGKFVLVASPASEQITIRVSALGFNDTYIDNPCAEVGYITLTPSTYNLDEIVISRPRPTTKLKTDGIQIAISDTYLAISGTALDVLGKLPFVIRSGSDLEVLGKSTPLIYINGRQVHDQSELDQLSSTQIKSVDVITNPGPRYPSTVNSVIRITTLSPVGEGFSFNDRTTVGFKHYVYLFQQVDFNYRNNGFDLFGMLNYENYRERPRYSNSAVQYLNSGTITQHSTGKDFVKYPVGQGKIGLNYNWQSNNMGFYYDFSYRPSFSNTLSSTNRYLNDIFTESLNKIASGSRYNRQHLLSAYYAGSVGTWHLTANFDAIWQINDSYSHENEISSLNPERIFNTVNNIENRLLAGNIIASLPVWKGDFRFGTEVSNIHRTDVYNSDTDYITASDIKIKETTTALFAETSQTFGNLSVTTGLRWEYTDSKYYQSAILSDDQSRTYHNLAPSISFSFPIGLLNTNISYTRKTTRPAFAQLSSAVRYLDRYSYESGNPNLRPIYRDYISVSGMWKNLVIMLDYISTKNYFMWQTSQPTPDSEITLLRMENMPRFSSFEASVNYSPVFFGCWHPSFMASVQTQNFKLTHHNTILKLNHPLGIIRFNNALHLPSDIWLNIDFSARTTGNSENLYLKSSWTCDLGLYKSFANDTWSLKLQLNDIFSTWRLDFTSYDPLSTLSTAKLRDTRDLSLTIRYNFNAARSRYKGRGVAHSDRDRL